MSIISQELNSRLSYLLLLLEGSSIQQPQFISDTDWEILTSFMDKMQRDSDVLALYLFGSALHSPHYQDLDVAIVLHPDATPKKMKVLLNFPMLVDGHFLADMPILIAKEAIKGQLLFNKDYALLFSIVMEIITQWEDFRPHYELYLEGVKHGV